MAFEALYSLGCDDGSYLKILENPENHKLTVVLNNVSITLEEYPMGLIKATSYILDSKVSTVKNFRIENFYGEIWKQKKHFLLSITNKQIQITNEEIEKFNDVLIKHYG